MEQSKILLYKTFQFIAVISILLICACNRNLKIDKENISVRDFGIKISKDIDQTRLIQKALNATSSKGKTLFFPKGNYYISGRIQIPSGTSIRGEDGEARIIQRSKNTTIFYANKVQEIEILGMEFMGEGTYSTEWTEASSHQDRGVSFFYSSKIKIGNCKFLNHGLAGLFFTNCSSVTIEDCKIEGTHKYSSPLKHKDNFQFGICFVVSEPFKAVGRNEILNNEISFVNQGVILTQGKSVAQELTTDIIGNDVHDIIGQHGLYISMSNVNIDSNTISKVGLEGIKIQASKTSLNGFKLKNNKAKDCLNSQAYNLTVVNKNFKLSNIEISNCSAVNCKRGLNISNWVENLSVNTFEVDNATQYGILLQGSKMRGLDFKEVRINNPQKQAILVNAKDLTDVRFFNTEIEKETISRKGMIQFSSDNDIRFNGVYVKCKSCAEKEFVKIEGRGGSVNGIQNLVFKNSKN